jgi:hypothetical protein
MPWSNQRPRRTKYDAAHNTEAARHRARLRAQGSGLCAEPVCIQPSRLITADMDLHLSHDPAGRVILGLSHARCNRSEAARRARAMQDASQLAW